MDKGNESEMPKANKKEEKEHEYLVELVGEENVVLVRARKVTIERGGCLAFTNGKGWTEVFAPSAWKHAQLKR